MAMVVANFSGGEAEELRRAMGFKRSQARMQEIEARLARHGAQRHRARSARTNHSFHHFVCALRIS